jgi:hypothetical protein
VLGVETSVPSVEPVSKGDGILPWIAALSLLIAVAAGGLFFFTGKTIPQEASAESADDYEIEEETP